MAKKITLFVDSKVKDFELNHLCEKFQKRIEKFCSLKVLQINKKKENFQKNSFLILLDARGKHFSSEEFALYLEKKFQMYPRKQILEQTIFII